MRIGFFGGSFDPVHLGHLIIAEQCRENCGLDEVWFVPSAVAPHKPGGSRAIGRQRREMLEFAIAGHPAFRVSEIELKRGGTSFTVDTLREIHEADPSVELFLLMGGDSLQGFSGWREPAEICRLATPLICHRPGHPVDFELLAPFLGSQQMQLVRDLSLQAIRIDISSTLIRDRIAAGRSVRYMIPRSVEKYIETTRLYTAAVAPSP